MQNYKWNAGDRKAFNSQLKYEEEQHKELAFFYEAIQKKLGEQCEIEVVDFHKSRHNQQLQKKGVDTILHFANGKKLYVQEKHIRNNKDSIYLEYEKPDGSPSWAIDSTELSQLLVFHYTRHGMAISVSTQKLVKVVTEMLPMWKHWYSKQMAVHSGYKGIKLPLDEFMKYEYELGLQVYDKPVEELDECTELFSKLDINFGTMSSWLN